MPCKTFPLSLKTNSLWDLHSIMHVNLNKTTKYYIPVSSLVISCHDGRLTDKLLGELTFWFAGGTVIVLITGLITVAGIFCLLFYSCFFSTSWLPSSIWRERLQSAGCKHPAQHMQWLCSLHIGAIIDLNVVRRTTPFE